MAGRGPYFHTTPQNPLKAARISSDMDGPSPTVKYLRDRFSDYYSNNQVVLPPRFGSREWAFFLWEGKGMLRHTAFLNKRKLADFMALKGPRHVYHSSAYYRMPAASTMGQKGWLGADLIFDIDADHIPGAEKMSYEEQLARVKVEVIKLVEEFLVGDLAFDPSHLTLVFSGGRGYHVHVRDPRVLELNSHERKEIVDYIMATDIDVGRLCDERVVAADVKGPYQKVHKGIDLPSPDEGGWRGRFRHGIDRLLSELEEAGREEALKRLQTGKGIGKKMAEDIYNVLFGGEQGKRGVDRIRSRNTLEIFDNEKQRNALKNLVLGSIKVEAGETDAPVTKDINRLIRLPGSLHGKSSLRVIPLDLDAVEAFLPLDDAVVFGDDPVKVDVKAETRFHIRREDFHVKAGGTELPMFAAVFLMARGAAEIDGD